MPQKYPITVLMAVYNGERYLSRSIESVLSQSCTNFEFLIIDDGSTDRSFEIIGHFAFQDERIRWVKQKNMGLTKSLNKGLLLAGGDYVARQDAGDMSKKDRLSTQKRFLDENPDVVLVGSSIDLIDEAGHVINTKHLPKESADIKSILRKKNCFSHGSMMFRKKEIKDIGGYREELKYSQDYDLVLRLSEKHKLSNLDDVLYQYRMDSQAISVENIEIQRLYRDYIKKLAGQRRTQGKDDLQTGNRSVLISISDKHTSKNAANAQYYARLAHEYSAGGKQGQAFKKYLRSLRFQPLKFKNYLLLARAAARFFVQRSTSFIHRTVRNRTKNRFLF